MSDAGRISAEAFVTGAPDRIRRVLVVDDSRLQVMLLAKLLSGWGYQADTALSAEEALGKLSTFSPDLIISDWMMPGLNGPDFCRALRDLDDQDYRYFILVTSKGETEDVAEGLDAGADDFLTKPVKPQELRARVAAGSRVVAMERELQEKNRLIAETVAQLQKAHDEIDADLAQARSIQEALVPVRSQVFGHTRVSLLMKPCGHVGGDLVGMFDSGLGAIGFFSIDVSGHGITSAMMTARVAGYLNSRFPDQNIALEQRMNKCSRLKEPQEVAYLLNQRLDADPGISEYLTMAFATLHLDSGEIQFVQAGHPPPVVQRASGRVEFLGQGGLPVGLFSEACYEGFSTKLEKGDRVFLYSDGFTECPMRNGEMLEESGFARLISEGEAGAVGTEFLDDLYWKLLSLMPEAAETSDDVSVAMLEYGVVDRP